MLRTLKRARFHILVVLVVFLAFLANATGIVEVFIELGADLELRPSALVPPEGEGLQLPRVVASAEFLTLLAVGVALSILLPVLPPIHASLLTFVSVFPIVWLGYTTMHRPLIPMEYSLLTVLVVFVVNVLVSYYSETHKKQELMEAFGHYVPPELVRRISREPERFSLEGEARELSVMFCDVHHFTTISEERGPRELAELLNTLFTPLTAILYRHRATIDKYMGDAIMAFWGAPLADPEHARRAIDAAFEMRAALGRLNPSFHGRGWPGISMGFGINSGVMNVGNMGSRYRVAYTVIGDAVNLAARLQELTRYYGCDIIVGETTRNAVPGLLYRELGLVQVKGKTLPARVYEPLGPEDQASAAVRERVARHEAALRRYYERDFAGAGRGFRELAEDQPDDLLPRLYLERIEAFRRDPPPADWHGEVRVSTK